MSNTSVKVVSGGAGGNAPTRGAKCRVNMMGGGGRRSHWRPLRGGAVRLHGSCEP
jgi:hypothetical protein